MDYDEYGFEDEYDYDHYQDEYSAFERVNIDRTSLLETKTDDQYSSLQNKLYRSSLTPEMIFDKKLEFFFSRFKRDIDLHDADLMLMSNQKVKFKNVDNINPAVYILGYYISLGGKNIDKNKLKEVLNRIIPSLEEEGIHIEDVIRYARHMKLYFD